MWLNCVCKLNCYLHSVSLCVYVLYQVYVLLVINNRLDFWRLPSLQKQSPENWYNTYTQRDKMQLICINSTNIYSVQLHLRQKVIFLCASLINQWLIFIPKVIIVCIAATPPVRRTGGAATMQTRVIIEEWGCQRLELIENMNSWSSYISLRFCTVHAMYSNISVVILLNIFKLDYFILTKCHTQVHSV